MSNFFTLVVIINKYGRMIFNKIVPGEYYLSSSDGYAMRSGDSSRQLRSNKSFMTHGQHFNNVP